GVSFAVGWTPCIGPILGAILMATSNAANAQAGMVYLSAYSLGMAIPFLASTLLVNRFSRHSRRLGKWSAYARPVAGGILILMGLAIVSGLLTRLASVLVSWFAFLATIGCCHSFFFHLMILSRCLASDRRTMTRRMPCPPSASLTTPSALCQPSRSTCQTHRHGPLR